MSSQAMGRGGRVLNGRGSVRVWSERRCTLQDSSHRPPGRGTSSGTVKKSLFARLGGHRGGRNRGAQRIFRAVRLLCDVTVMDTCHYPFVQTQRCAMPRVTSNVSHGLGMIMTCQCMIISCSKQTIWQEILMLGEVVHMQEEIYGNPLCFLLKFAVNLNLRMCVCMTYVCV